MLIARTRVVLPLLLAVFTGAPALAQTIATNCKLDDTTLSCPSKTTPSAAPDSTGLLGYNFFDRPSKKALAIAMAGLAVFDGEFVSTQIQWGDSVAQITGRVRDESWASNPEVWAYEGDVPRVFFGHLRTYLRGNPRFRILVRPASCAHCDHDRDRSAVFLPYAIGTGYLVGGGRTR